MLKEVITLDGQSLDWEEVRAILRGFVTLELSDEARKRMIASREFVASAIEEGQTIYGVNTGFGRLAETRVPNDKNQTLQLNLIRSHAAGTGRPLYPEEVRLLLAIRANTLAAGLSGCRPEIVEAICNIHNQDVIPVIPELGSLGASGDLAPLAHLALVLIGEGEAFIDGERMPGLEALRLGGLEPIQLEAKEGLSLINGTQVMTALGARSARKLYNLVRHADVAAAFTTDAQMGTDIAFDFRIHEARNQHGQKVSAQNLWTMLQESEIRKSHADCGKVQDAYSIRCTPQVHGAVRDSLIYGRDVLTRELNAVTDNPLIFLNEDGSGEILSGGNFHGEPVALVLDQLAIAATELASISERRIERLLNPDTSGGLPPFLAPEPGLTSGFMMAHVTAAAVVSESKILSHPASVDSIPTSGGQEDHVSMGMTAAVKLRRVLANTEWVIATEFLCAAQALDLLAPLKPSEAIQAAHTLIRDWVPTLDNDRPPAPDVQAITYLMREGSMLEAIAEVLGNEIE